MDTAFTWLITSCDGSATDSSVCLPIIRPHFRQNEPFTSVPQKGHKTSFSFADLPPFEQKFPSNSFPHSAHTFFVFTAASPHSGKNCPQTHFHTFHISFVDSSQNWYFNKQCCTLRRYPSCYRLKTMAVKFKLISIRHFQAVALPWGSTPCKHLPCTLHLRQLSCNSFRSGGSFQLKLYGYSFKKSIPFLK